MTDRSVKAYAGRLVQSPGFPGRVGPGAWLDEIAARWPRLSPDDRAQLAEEMAGRSENARRLGEERLARIEAESREVPPLVPGGGKRRIVRKPNTMGG